MAKGRAIMVRRPVLGILTLGAVAAAFGGVAAVGGPTAGAQAPPGVEIDVAGNFAGDEREELFAYVGGTFTDVMVSFTNGGTSGGDITWEEFPFQVNGSYEPVAGNFDGDGYDEILWYGPGSMPDRLWNFSGGFTSAAVTSTVVTVSGNYWPLVGDFTGDGVEDVFWYGPGSLPDAMWDFNADGGRTSRAVNVSGSYVPITGSFGRDATDDVIWYRAGSGSDSMWDFVIGSASFRSTALSVNGVYEPFSLDMFADGPQGGDVFWYAPGSRGDVVWDFVFGSRVSVPEAVNGTYGTLAGDFLGDGHDDIFWFDATGFRFWDHAPDGSGGVDRWSYRFVAGAAVTSASRSAGAAVPGEGPVREGSGFPVGQVPGITATGGPAAVTRPARG
jgi:hypothetical protein